MYCRVEAHSQCPQSMKMCEVAIFFSCIMQFVDTVLSIKTIHYTCTYKLSVQYVHMLMCAKSCTVHVALSSVPVLFFQESLSSIIIKVVLVGLLVGLYISHFTISIGIIRINISMTLHFSKWTPIIIIHIIKLLLVITELLYFHSSIVWSNTGS